MGGLWGDGYFHHVGPFAVRGAFVPEAGAVFADFGGAGGEEWAFVEVGAFGVYSY